MNKILLFLCLVTTSLSQYSSRNYLPPNARRTEESNGYASPERSLSPFQRNPSGEYGAPAGNGEVDGYSSTRNGAAGRIAVNGGASVSPASRNGYSTSTNGIEDSSLDVNGYSSNGNSNGYSTNGNGYSSNGDGNGYSGRSNSNGYSSNGNGNGYSGSKSGNGYSSNGNGYSSNGDGNGYSINGNGYSSNGNGNGYSSNGNGSPRAGSGLLNIRGFNQEGPISSDEQNGNGLATRDFNRPANGNRYSQYGASNGALGSSRLSGANTNGIGSRRPSGGQNGQGYTNGNGYSNGNGNRYQSTSQLANDSSQDDENSLSEPAKYEFKYDVYAPEYSVEFGHQEQRDGDLTEGSYYVLLPDGRRQLVEYTADRDGYKPRITYTEAAAGADGRGSNGEQEGGYYQGGEQQSADNYQGGQQGNYGRNQRGQQESYGRNQSPSGGYSGNSGSGPY